MLRQQIVKNCVKHGIAALIQCPAATPPRADLVPSLRIQMAPYSARRARRTRR